MDFKNIKSWTIGGQEVKTLEINGQIFWQKEEAPSVNYFYVEDCSGGANEVWFTKYGSPTTPNLEYSTDGSAWITWSDPYTEHIQIQPNQKVFFRGTNDTVSYNMLTTLGNFNVGGDLTCLLDPNGGVDDLASRNYCFAYLFNNSKLIVAKQLKLVSTKLSNGCYSNLFSSSTITIPPEIINSKVENYSFEYMFLACSNLTSIKINTSEWGYYSAVKMLRNCKKLNRIEVDIKQWNQYYTENWVQGVSASGTFVKPKELIVGDGDGQIPMGPSGIPSGWEIVDK